MRPLDDSRRSFASETAVDFLKKLRPCGPWVLTAIEPDGKIETITARNADAAFGFIRANEGKRNLYYSVNPTTRTMTSKAAKVDIAAVEYLFADLDPKEDESPEAAKARYSRALQAYEPAPTAIVDSGNGIQALWKLGVPTVLDPPVPTDRGNKIHSPETAAVINDIEARAQAIMLALGSVAGTQNVDRILRLPGTTNLPNKKKIKAGRVACATKLIQFNGSIHPLEAFPAAVADRKSTPQETRPLDIVATLPVSERIKNLIRGIDDPEHHYDSRSERVFAVLVALAGAGCNDEQMAAIMRAESLPIGQHVREQRDHDAYLVRQIVEARKAAIDSDVAELNEKYALVLVGDKIAVMNTSTAEIQFLTISAFERWLANRFVVRGGRRLRLAKTGSSIRSADSTRGSCSRPAEKCQITLTFGAALPSAANLGIARDFSLT